MNELYGKTAIITGASCGIGKEIAISLASIGADIVCAYAGNSIKANETKDEIEALGRNCTLI